MRENCTPGSVRGASGNQRPYRDDDPRIVSAQLNIVAEDSHDRGRCDCCGCSSRAVSGWIEEQDVEGRGAARHPLDDACRGPRRRRARQGGKRLLLFT